MKADCKRAFRCSHFVLGENMFGFGKKTDINTGIEEYKKTEGAILIDVREAEEYASGHIPKAINHPLSQIKSIGDLVQKKDRPVFVYCLSGGRSGKAAEWMKKQGFSKVKNIGGIADYRGPME